MVRRIGHVLAMVILSVAAAGCASGKARFYTLDSTAAATGASASYAVAVGQVAIPASVDRPELVVQVAANQVALDEFNRWAAPLGDSIARVVAGDLEKLLGTPKVAVGPLVNFVPAYRVTLDVQRFESTPGKGVLVEAVWIVERTAGGGTRSGRTVAHEDVQAKGFDAIAAAHSRALATVSGDIAEAIRAEAARGATDGAAPKRRSRQ
jgi:uncharacterized lipoprotein YmbA